MSRSGVACTVVPRIARDPAELTVAFTAAGLIASLCVLLGPLLATVVFAIGSGLEVSGPGLVYAALAVVLAIGCVLIAGIRAQAPPEPDPQRMPIVHEMGAGFR